MRATRNSQRKKDTPVSRPAIKRRKENPSDETLVETEPHTPVSAMQLMMEQLKSLQEKVSSMENRQERESEEPTDIDTEDCVESEMYRSAEVGFTPSGWLEYDGEPVDVESMVESEVSSTLMYLIVESNGSNLYGLSDTLKKRGLTKKQLEVLQKQDFSEEHVPPHADNVASTKVLNDFEDRANLAVESFASRWQLSDVWNHMFRELQVPDYKGTWFQRRYRVLKLLYGDNYRRAAIIELFNLLPQDFEDFRSYITVYAWLWILGGHDGHAADLIQELFDFLKSDLAWQTMQRADLRLPGWIRLCSDEIAVEWTDARATAKLESNKRDYTRPKRVRPAKKTRAMKRGDVQSIESTVLRDRYHSNRCFKCGSLDHVVVACTNEGTDNETEYV